MHARVARWTAALGLVLAAPTTVRAQALIAILLGDKLSTDRFQLGINVSAAGTGFTGVPNRLRVSWGIGMYGEVRLGRALRLVPELVLKAPAGATRLNTHAPGYPFAPPGEPTLDDLVTNGEVMRALHYIALPVAVKWVYGPIGLGLGPQLGVLGRARDTVSATVDQGELQLTASIRKSMRPVDAGVFASLEYAFQPHKAMRSARVRAKGYYGLVDVISGDHGKPVRNWHFMLGVDVPIGGPGTGKNKDKAQAPPP